MKIFKIIINFVISFIFPNTCINCDDIIDEGEYFCEYCNQTLDRIDYDKQCVKCCLPKKNCDCKKKVFSFEGVIAPFYNRNGAQKAMYEYKFRGKRYISKFFAEQIALAIKYVWYGLKFDGVCYVPLSKNSYKKRGFNQSKEIAKIISQILNVPILDGQLGCINKRNSQHSMSGSEREKNVKGVYFSKKPISGKILLIDDIKTTGFTLEECSKQLLSAGADSVYCAVGLITYYRGKKG